MSKRFQPHIIVSLGHKNWDDKLDDRITVRAECYGGMGIGVGYSFGTRHMEFQFFNLRDATKFIRYVKRLKDIEFAYSESHLFADDYYSAKR